MSWALRAHIRNLVLRASLGSSYASSAELKKGVNAKCTVDLCPYPGFDAVKSSPPPTDDDKFVHDQIEAAYQNFFYKHVIHAKFAPDLKKCIRHPETKALVSDLFWYCYLKRYGIHYAAKYESTLGQDTFREVLTQVFLENDIDDSGSVDANELSALLGRLDVDLSPECCAELIAVVDADGNGELDLEEFLDMMCIEIISDVYRDKVHLDMKQLHQRCSANFCKVVSPFEHDLEARDAVQPACCSVLVEAVLKCFDGCFGMRPDRQELEESIEEAVMIWFTGMRMPVHPIQSGKKQKPVKAAEEESVATASVPERRDSVWDAELGEGLTIEEMRKSVASTRKRVPILPKSDRPATAGPRKVASLSTIIRKHPGQRQPPVPSINLAGCSEAFTETFKTPRPSQPLHTLRQEHASWNFEEGRHSRYAERCAEWRTSRPNKPELTEADFVLPTSSRSTAKVARRFHLARAERLRETEIIAQREYTKVRSLFTAAMEGEKECLELDNVTGAVGWLRPLHKKLEALLAGAMFRYLRQNERKRLQKDSLIVGKKIAQHDRELRFRRLREENLANANV